MAKIVVQGGARLTGTVKISGAKNAALPIMAAALLAEEESIIDNVPNLRDIQTMVRLLRSLGAKVSLENEVLYIRPPCL